MQLDISSFSVKAALSDNYQNACIHMTLVQAQQNIQQCYCYQENVVGAVLGAWEVLRVHLLVLSKQC